MQGALTKLESGSLRFLFLLRALAFLSALAASSKNEICDFGGPIAHRLKAAARLGWRFGSPRAQNVCGIYGWQSEGLLSRLKNPKDGTMDDVRRGIVIQRLKQNPEEKAATHLDELLPESVAEPCKIDRYHMYECRLVD